MEFLDSIWKPKKTFVVVGGKFSAQKVFQLAEILRFDEKHSSCNMQGEQCGRHSQRRPADVESILELCIAIPLQSYIYI